MNGNDICRCGVLPQNQHQHHEFRKKLSMFQVMYGHSPVDKPPVDSSFEDQEMVVCCMLSETKGHAVKHCSICQQKAGDSAPKKKIYFTRLRA